MRLSKSDTPVMVFIVDKYNNMKYVSYTGDLSKNTYTLDNEPYGKHLFKRHIIFGNDLKDLEDKSPAGTEFIDYLNNNSKILLIDYYIHPKSVPGLLLTEYSEISKRTFKDNISLKEDIKNLKERLKQEKSLRVDNRINDSKIDSLKKNLNSLKASFSDLNSENEKLKEEIYKLKIKDCKNFSLKFLFFFLVALFSFLFLVT